MNYTCRHCGKLFDGSNRRMQEGPPAYCSRPCRLDGQRAKNARSWEKQKRDTERMRTTYRPHRPPKPAGE